MITFTEKEKRLLRRLDTPTKIQDFLNTFPFNFEKEGETLKSPASVLSEGRKAKIHCFEGALLGAYILSLHGFKPLLLHLEATIDDYDHVIAPFQVDGYWGALSKTNHSVLRYREPIYKNIRELAMSYFHEYFLNNGTKTLRRYSVPFNLDTLNKKNNSKNTESWVENEKDLWFIDKKLDKIKHYKIVPKKYLKKLRKADKIEIKAGKIIEFKK
jgi:hypothetical protein